MTNPATSLDRLTEQKNRLDSYRPLPPEAVANLHEDLLLRWTYHSNAIEGNTLTLKETKVALEGITIGDKTMTEHQEAINHRDAIQYVEELVTEQGPLSENQVKSIQQLILRNIDDAHAGAYRKVNVTIAGAEHRPPDAVHVASQMQEFITECQQMAASLHPVEQAARVHAELAGIHPFVDGNGRTSRLVMNLELMKAGYPPAVITVEQRLAYYEALDAAHVHQDYQPFLQLIYDCVAKAFEPYWHALGVSDNR